MKSFESLPEVKKITACENFIRKQFKKHNCKGIRTELMFEEAEKAGLYVKGVFGSVFSQALANTTTVETYADENGDFLYSTFQLKHEYKIVITNKATKEESVFGVYRSKDDAESICEAWGWNYDDGKQSYWMGYEEA